MGHSHVPSAVTGGPVAPTRRRQARVFKARLSEGIHSGFVAVIPPPTALLTRRIRPTGFRSSSISSYYNGFGRVCQGVFVNFLANFKKKIMEVQEKHGIHTDFSFSDCQGEEFFVELPKKISSKQEKFPKIL